MDKKEYISSLKKKISASLNLKNDNFNFNDIINEKTIALHLIESLPKENLLNSIKELISSNIFKDINNFSLNEIYEYLKNNNSDYIKYLNENPINFEHLNLITKTDIKEIKTSNDFISFIKNNNKIFFTNKRTEFLSDFFSYVYNKFSENEKHYINQELFAYFKDGANKKSHYNYIQEIKIDLNSVILNHLRKCPDQRVNILKQMLSDLNNYKKINMFLQYSKILDKNKNLIELKIINDEIKKFDDYQKEQLVKNFTSFFEKKLTPENVTKLYQNNKINLLSIIAKKQLNFIKSLFTTNGDNNVKNSRKNSILPIIYLGSVVFFFTSPMLIPSAIFASILAFVPTAFIQVMIHKDSTGRYLNNVLLNSYKKEKIKNTNFSNIIDSSLKNTIKNKNIALINNNNNEYSSETLFAQETEIEIKNFSIDLINKINIQEIIKPQNDKENIKKKEDEQLKKEEKNVLKKEEEFLIILSLSKTKASSKFKEIEEIINENEKIKTTQEYSSFVNYLNKLSEIGFSTDDIVKHDDEIAEFLEALKQQIVDIKVNLQESKESKLQVLIKSIKKT